MYNTYRCRMITYLVCVLHSNGSLNSVKAAISKEMEFYETESLPLQENSSDIAEAFTKLIDGDKDLYNKILRYEPVNIESLHCTLRTRGFKCKLSNLMSFLDEQVRFLFFFFHLIQSRILQRTT